MAALVSVIIPAYRAAALIGEALASVTAQTYLDWEIVVVEDGTDDGTAALLAELANSWGADRVRYHRHTVNQGLSATRNTAIQLARGQYIALLDHDDLWQPQHLTRAVATLEAQQADLTYAQARFFEDGSHRSLGLCGPNAQDLEQFPGSLLSKNFVPVCTVVMRKPVWTQLGGFDPLLKRVEDLDFWLRVVEAGFKFAYIPEVTGGYRQSNPAAMTANKAEILEWHALVLRKHRHLSAVPTRLRNRVLARANFGVARRSISADWRKAWRFFVWPWPRVPDGAISALGDFAKDALRLPQSAVDVNT